MFAVPGRRNGVRVYQEERFYLEVLSPYDLNGDGTVDCADVCLLVEQWHTDDLRYDLAPAPEGDGLVDAQDLLVLSDHLGEDLRLITHWMLDETEGIEANDSVGGRHGEVEWEVGPGTSKMLRITRDFGGASPVLHVDLPACTGQPVKTVVTFQFTLKNLWK